MKDKLIIIDFDHTIFNTTEFVLDLKQFFKKIFNIDYDFFDKIRDEVKFCCTVIDVDNFVNKLSTKYKNKKEMHDALIDFIDNYGKNYIFDDVYNFFENNKKNLNTDIIIITHGDRELQLHKIASAFLPGDYDVVISLANKNKEVKKYLNKYKEIIFIDDKPKNIIDVKSNISQVITYFVKRTQDAPYGKDVINLQQADYIISNLKEIEL